MPARHEIVFNDENHKVFVDNEDCGSLGADLSSSTLTCWLFGGNSEGSAHRFAAGRIYECQILTNNVLARSFKPVVDGNGATFDLSEMGSVATFETTSANRNNVLSFEDNATIKVKIGERRIAASTPIVSWSEQPSNLDTLTFVCDDPERAYRISKTSSGLYVQDVGGLVIIFE